MPQQFSAAVAQRAEAAAVTAPPAPPQTVSWRWTLPPGHRITFWESSEDLRTWVVEGWTKTNFVRFPVTNAAKFFRFYSLHTNCTLAIGVGKQQAPDFWQP